MYNTFKYSLDKSAKITKFNTYSPNHLSANHSPPAEGCPKGGVGAHDKQCSHIKKSSQLKIEAITNCIPSHS